MEEAYAKDAKVTQRALRKSFLGGRKEGLKRGGAETQRKDELGGRGLRKVRKGYAKGAEIFFGWKKRRFETRRCRDAEER